MSSEKVARLLASFDQPEPKARSRIIPFDYAQHSGPKVQPKPASPPPSDEDDAYQRGSSNGYATASAEFEQKLADEKHRLSMQLAEERHSLLNEMATRIAGEIAEAGAQLEAKIAGVTARILEPFISNAVQKQAVATFIEQLASVASDVRRPALRVTCPAELVDVLRGKLAVRSIAVELRAAPVAEVSVTVDQVFLETQIKLWAERLKFGVLN